MSRSERFRKAPLVCEPTVDNDTVLASSNCLTHEAGKRVHGQGGYGEGDRNPRDQMAMCRTSRMARSRCASIGPRDCDSFSARLLRRCCRYPDPRAGPTQSCGGARGHTRVTGCRPCRLRMRPRRGYVSATASWKSASGSGTGGFLQNSVMAVRISAFRPLLFRPRQRRHLAEAAATYARALSRGRVESVSSRCPWRASASRSAW